LHTGVVPDAPKREQTLHEYLEYQAKTNVKYLVLDEFQAIAHHPMNIEQLVATIHSNNAMRDISNNPLKENLFNLYAS
jgi:DNA-dependent RNA polymerase auxiliary subunit epsilon